MDLRLKDEFLFEALKYQLEDLNFSFSNAMDFWKVRENQKIQTQKVFLPVAFRQYDKNRKLLNTINGSPLKRNDVSIAEQRQKSEIIKKNENLEKYEILEQQKKLEMKKKAEFLENFGKNIQENLDDSKQYENKENFLQTQKDEKNDKIEEKILDKIEDPEALKLRKIPYSFSPVVEKQKSPLVDASFNPYIKSTTNNNNFNFNKVEQSTYEQERLKIKEKIKQFSEGFSEKNDNNTNNHPNEKKRDSSLSPIRKALYIDTELINSPTTLRRMTSNFGGNFDNLDEIGIELLNKRQEKGETATFGNNAKTLEEIEENKVESQKNINLKGIEKLRIEKNNSENTKTVSFKEVENLGERNEYLKLKKPPALLKSTSIKRYEHPALLNEENEYKKEFYDKSPTNMDREIMILKKRSDEYKHEIAKLTNYIDEKQAELKKTTFLENFFMKTSHDEKRRYKRLSRNMNVFQALAICMFSFFFGIIYGHYVNIYPFVHYLLSQI